MPYVWTLQTLWSRADKVLSLLIKLWSPFLWVHPPGISLFFRRNVYVFLPIRDIRRWIFVLWPGNGTLTCKRKFRSGEWNLQIAHLRKLNEFRLFGGNRQLQQPRPKLRNKTFHSKALTLLWVDVTRYLRITTPQRKSEANFKVTSPVR